MKINIVSSLIQKAQKDFKLSVFHVVLVAGFYSLPAQALTITTSIPPIAGIIAPLLGEEDTINVILKPGQSPHGFQMSPANMKQLAVSDLVVWAGTPVDVWLSKPIKTIKTSQVAIHDLEGLVELPVRHGGVWEKHLHKLDEHASNAHKDDEHIHEQKTTEASKPSNNLRMDGHLWMSYENAVLLVKAVAKKLTILQPEKAQIIETRKQQWLALLAQTDQSLEEELHKIKHKPYLVLHDAFQYFESRYGLNGVGSIQLNPMISPSLKRVAELRKKIQDGEVKCVFKEPQFPEKRVLSVVRGLDVKVGSLDPIGLVEQGNAVKGQENYLPYDVFLKRLGQQYLSCLASK